MDVFFQSEGFDTIGFEGSVWKRAGGGKHAEDIYVYLQHIFLNRVSIFYFLLESGHNVL